MATNNAADYSPTRYNVQVGGANGTLSSVAPSATSGIPLVSGGSSANPSFTTAVVAGGGTGAVTLTGVLIGNGTSAVTGNAVTQYDVLVGGSSNAISSVGPGSSGQVLQSGGNAANPAYSTATYPSTTTINQLLYSSSANTVGGVTAGNYGVLISSSAGAPSWLSNGTTGQLLTATTSGTPSWGNAPASSITITGDSGGGLTGNSFTFTGGTTGLTFSGATATETLTGTLIVGNGGTGVATTTAYAVLCGGTSSTGALQSIASVGSSGQVLTSNGAGMLPTFQAAAGGGISTLDGNSGSATGSTVTITTGASNTQGTAKFTGSSATVTLAFSDASSNVGLGSGALSSGSFSASASTCIGVNSGASITSGNSNTCFGFGTGRYITTAFGNTFIGEDAGEGSASTAMTSPTNTGCGQFALNALTTGSGLNCALGYEAGGEITTGAYNTLVGGNAGFNYSSSESSNICIGYNTEGTASESHVLRIGNGTGNSTAGNVNATYISGITGITVTGSAVYCSTGNQLGPTSSSRRFKKDIQSMTDESSALYKLRPVSFLWDKDSAPGLKDATDLRQYGFIAEEAVEHVPYVVNLDKDGAPFNINYAELVGMLVNEIQKLNKRIEALEAK